jgi:hypothetical protein
MPVRFLSVLPCMLVLCAAAASANAQNDDGLPRVGAPPWQTVELGHAGHRYPFPVYSSLELAPAKLSRIRHVLVMVHGVDRNADGYYETGAGLLWLNPAALDDTLVVAPRFVSTIDRGFEKMPAWSRGGWAAGNDSVKAASRPAPISSFTVLDDLLLRLGDRTLAPQLQDIVVAGHSAGGQMVQRYAAFNNVDERLRKTGVALRYVVANPSSYVYFTRDRPQNGSKTFQPYNPGLCPEFNSYRYGMEHLPPGLRESDAGHLAGRYAGRDVTYLLGGADNNPEHRLLDKSCAAEAEGATRLARGRAYLRYEAWLPAMKNKHDHPAYEVVGIGHNNREIFGSVCGARALLGPDAQGAPGGAQCKAPE